MSLRGQKKKYSPEAKLCIVIFCHLLDKYSLWSEVFLFVQLQKRLQKQEFSFFLWLVIIIPSWCQYSKCRQLSSLLLASQGCLPVFRLTFSAYIMARPPSSLLLFMSPFGDRRYVGGFCFAIFFLPLLLKAQLSLLIVKYDIFYFSNSPDGASQSTIKALQLTLFNIR